MARDVSTLSECMQAWQWVNAVGLAQAAPQDPRLAALKGLHGNPGARRPSPTRPVKPDSAALGVDSGRPKRPPRRCCPARGGRPTLMSEPE